MAEVVSTTIKKIRWIERITFDQRLTTLTVRVGCAIAWHLNRDRGDARVGHLKLAERLGVDKRSIARAVNELAAFGHIDVERGEPIGRRKDGSAVYGGRGSASTIRLTFKTVEAPLEDDPDGEKRGTCESLLDDGGGGKRGAGRSLFPNRERVTPDANKSDSGQNNEGRGSHPNPYNDSVRTRKRRSSAGDRSFSGLGRYMRELGEKIAPGMRGLNFIIQHPESERIIALCRRLRDGALSEGEIDALREEALEWAGSISLSGRRQEHG